MMPFLKTFPAAGCGSVLGDKNGVIFHRGLFAVIFRICGAEAFGYEIKGMLLDSFQTFSMEVLQVLSVELESAPEL
jgi:hypothetical protein